MRPEHYHAVALVELLRRTHIATIQELKAALGTAVDMTVFRKLREIAYHSSYSHRGKYYTLAELARFDLTNVGCGHSARSTSLGSVRSSRRWPTSLRSRAWASSPRNWLRSLRARGSNHFPIWCERGASP